MHKEAFLFFLNLSRLYTRHFQESIVLDFGSSDINGGLNTIFYRSLYIGVDLDYSKNVDLVLTTHSLNLGSSVDTVVSSSALEHDYHYTKSFKNMYANLKPGGLFALMVASKGCRVHGTPLSDFGNAAPNIQNTRDFFWQHYYRNLEEYDIQRIMNLNYNFTYYEIKFQPITHDLYFFGFKNGQYIKSSNHSFLNFSNIINTWQRSEIDYLKNADNYKHILYSKSYENTKNILDHQQYGNAEKYFNKYDFLDQTTKLKMSSYTLFNSQIVNIQGFLESTDINYNTNIRHADMLPGYHIREQILSIEDSTFSITALCNDKTQLESLTLHLQIVTVEGDIYNDGVICNVIE